MLAVSPHHYGPRRGGGQGNEGEIHPLLSVRTEPTVGSVKGERRPRGVQALARGAVARTVRTASRSALRGFASHSGVDNERHASGRHGGQRSSLVLREGRRHCSVGDEILRVCTTQSGVGHLEQATHERGVVQSLSRVGSLRETVRVDEGVAGRSELGGWRQAEECRLCSRNDQKIERHHGRLLGEAEADEAQAPQAPVDPRETCRGAPRREGRYGTGTSAAASTRVRAGD